MEWQKTGGECKEVQLRGKHKSSGLIHEASFHNLSIAVYCEARMSTNVIIALIYSIREAHDIFWFIQQPVMSIT
jgi:hypothetical protein